MKNQKGISTLVGIITIVLAVVILFGFFIYQYFATQKTNNQPQAQSQNNQNAGWKTYTNDPYGFSFSYPADFANVNDLTIAQQNSLITYMGVCPVGNNAHMQPNESSFCYIGKQTSDGFAAASFNIIPSVSTSVQDCKKPEQSGPAGELTQIEQIVVNGIVFHHAQFTDASLGHYALTDFYRTYHGGACYAIYLNIETDRGASEKGLSVDFSSMMHSKLESVISTFKFTK
jgi:hypothetical protein